MGIKIGIIFWILLFTGFPGSLNAKSGDVLFEDPLNGSIVTGWRNYPESFIKLPESGMVYNLLPTQPGTFTLLPWAGDQSWVNYRIEIEFMIKKGENRGFIGIQFHVQEDSIKGNNIGLYTGGELPSERWFETSVHYNKTNLSWKLWPTSQKSFDLRTDTWIKLRIDVDTSYANVYVDNDTIPVYTTYGLPFKNGGIRFWQYGGAAYLRNLKVTELSADETHPILPNIWTPAIKFGLLNKWRVTPILDPEVGIDSLPPEIQTDQIAWSPISADERGVMNISSFYPENKSKGIIFARTYVYGRSDGPAIALFSYTDRANVWCNDKLVFKGKARGWYDKDNIGPGDGFGRLLPSLFEFEIPMDKPENELIIGLEIREPQFGSGFHMRLR